MGRLETLDDSTTAEKESAGDAGNLSYGTQYA